MIIGLNFDTVHAFINKVHNLLYYIDDLVLVFSAETLSKGFTIIIDNRHGTLTSSVKKLLSAAEVGKHVLISSYLSVICDMIYLYIGFHYLSLIHI